MKIVSLPVMTRLALAGALLAPAATASAAMGNIATTYGLLPADMATAQALSMFSDQASAAYYNPAYLVHDPRGEFSAGLLTADYNLKAESQGGSNPPARNDDVLQDGTSEQTVLGFKTDLSGLTTLDHPINLGVTVGIEEYSQQVLAFNSETSQKGQYFNYDRQSLFLNLGLGTYIWRGVSLGAGTLITLKNNAELETESDLAGNTEQESLTVETEPDMKGIASLNVDWGKTLCPEGRCWADGLQTALAYRQESSYETNVDANAVIPGTIPPPGLSFSISTLDQYQPSIYAAGLSWRGRNLEIGLTLEQQNWSDLEDDLEDDTIKDHVAWEFKDIVIPRLGAEYRVGNYLALRGGLAYRESPLQTTQSADVNYLDTDRWIGGLGLSAEFPNFWVLAHPLRVDLAYQYHKLEERDFQMASEDAPSNPYETVTASGDVHVLTGSITLKF